MEYEPVVTTSVAKQIAETIRAAILDGRLKVDERLPTEEELAQRYGVSRPTIREALKRLAAQNLIRSRRGPAGGTFVNKPRPEETAESLLGAATLLVSLGAFGMDDIAAARTAFEGECCRLAAANRTDADLARLEAALAVLADPATTDEDFCAADVAFHRAVVDATGNALIRFVMYAVVEAMAPITNMIIVRVRRRADILDLHRALRDALVRRDGAAAAAVLERLVAYLQDRYEEARARRAASDG